MLNRQLIEFGLHPALGYFLAILAFLGFSAFLYFKTEFAPYIYVFLALTFMSQLGTHSRCEFLKNCFSVNVFRKIRLLENAFIALPFFIFLLFKSDWLMALILLFLSSTMALSSFNNKWNKIIWTPFSKRPFEFPVGFRKTHLLIIAAYFIGYIGTTVDNFNLGLSSLLIIFFTCMSYYINPEGAFYVWIFSSKPKPFLFNKIKTALLSSTLLCLPLTVGLGLAFPDSILIIIGIQCLGYTYLLATLLAKYSAYPNNISLPQGIIFGLGLWLPPLLLGIIPFFYLQSIKRLKEQLV